MAVKRTPEQEAVVKNRGGGLLVSAAAGSGKTRVLVERLLDRILYEEKNINEFLIITFTRAAAEELRGRIAGELKETQTAHPENTHLRRQSALLYETQISTIHAFCTVLLRQWGHLLDIPSDFTLCEDEEASVLMARTLDQLLEERYENIDPDGDFAQLLDLLSAGRDDSRLLEIVLDIYKKIQSASDPMAWLEEQCQALDISNVTDAGQTPWGKLLLEDAKATGAYWKKQMKMACDLALEDPILEKAYLPSLQETTQAIEDFEVACAQGWDAAAERGVIPFSRLGSSRGVENVSAQEEIKSLRDRCKKAMGKVADRLSSPSASLLEDMTFLYTAMRGLFDLTADFSNAYDAEKKKRAMLDFSDLEHYAVRLLVNDQDEPTELARQWGQHYAEIMVDEYQDTNQVQNTIFRAISQDGKNLFLVGDVKQSIYRFRLADPTIFLEKYRTFRPYEQAAVGEDRRITLSKNFRSRPEVLEAANDLFRCVMSRELGELDYTNDQALYPGGTFPGGVGYETELHVLDFSEDPAYTEQKIERSDLEARFVARQISDLLKSGFLISDNQGGTRPLTPDDVAILLRSPGPVRQYYTQALEDQGVNWSAEEGNDLFQTTEVSVALSWLQIIDNPRQDIPLLAVLRSPVMGFTGDRLAAIRMLSEGDFYTALQTAAAQGWPDCADFLTQLENLRFGVGESTSHQLLWNLYRKTDLLEIFSAMPGGEKRRENLLSFYQLARRFEGAGHKGLFGFLLHLDRVRKNGSLQASTASHKENTGVKILSIHRSKGLEYPVVFLCGLGRQFNKSDQKKRVLFHPKLGLGPKGLDRETMVEFTTLAREGVALALDKEMMAEEMRLLYVAMTRAKEKLIMTHALPARGNPLKTLGASLSYPADPRVLRSCAGPGEWVLLAAMLRPEGEVLRRAGGQDGSQIPVAPLGSVWQIEYHSGAVLQEVGRRHRRKTTEERLPRDLSPEEIVARLQWQYPYAGSSATPAKITATQVAKQDMDELGVFLLRERETDKQRPFYRPTFAQESMGLTAAQRGTALHKVMQSIRLDKTGSTRDVEEELARLTAQGYLTEPQAQSVSPISVARFFAGDLGYALRENPTLQREYPFSLLVDANRFYPDTPLGEEIMLQGVIDGWFETEEGITLFDFKTDRVPTYAAYDRAQRYRGQLAAYAYALETLTQKPVIHRLLWFLHPGVGIDLAEENEKN